MLYQTQFVEIKSLPPAESFLTASESAYLQTLRAEKRKGDWLGGRFALKVLLARESGLLPLCSLPPIHPTNGMEMSTAALSVLKQIEVVKMPSGAPQVFVGSVPDARSVSITHSNGWAVAALSAPHTFLGIDLEKIEPRMQAWAEDFFTPQEREPMTPAHLTELWTKKEAVVKLLGRGLSVCTREVSFGGGTLQLSGESRAAWQALGQPQIQLTSAPFGTDFIFTVAYAPALATGKFGKI